MKPRVSPHLTCLLSSLVRSLRLMQASETSEAINALNFFRLLPTQQADAIHEMPQKKHRKTQTIQRTTQKTTCALKESLSDLRASFKRWNADWCLDKGRVCSFLLFLSFLRVEICFIWQVVSGSQVSSCLARARKSRGDREGSIA